MLCVFWQRGLLETIFQYQFGVSACLALLTKASNDTLLRHRRDFIQAWPKIDRDVVEWLPTASLEKVFERLDDDPTTAALVVFCFVCTGNVAMLQALHPSRHNLHEMDFNLMLGLAAAGGHVAMLEYLFETIPQPQLPLKIPMLPMEYAAKEGHVDVVEYLVDGQHMEPQHGLYAACGRGHVNVFKFLHSRMHLSKMPALYTCPQVFHMYFVVAFARGHMDSIVPYLLDQLDGHMDMTVDMAVSLGHLRATQFLLERDPTCSALALHKAARLGAMDILEWIVEKKYTETYHTAYKTAAACGQLKIVQFLQPFVARSAIRDAFFNAATHRQRDVATYLAALASEDELLAWFERAAIQGNLPAVQFLYRPSRRHRRAISHAARYDHLDVLQWLNAKGDTSKLWSSWQHAKQIAVKYKHVEIEEWLDGQLCRLCI